MGRIHFETNLREAYASLRRGALFELLTRVLPQVFCFASKSKENPRICNVLTPLTQPWSFSGIALTHSYSSSLFFIALHVRKKGSSHVVHKVSQTSSKLFVSNIFFQSQVKWPLKQTPSAIGQKHPASNDITNADVLKSPSDPNTSFQSWQKPLMTRDTASSGARPRLVRYSNLTQSIWQLGDSWAKQYKSEYW